MSSSIAIIGMSGRFPGAASVSEFWENLKNGVESVTRFTDEQVLAAGVNPATLTNPDFVKVRAVVDSPEMFDAAFFGFMPRDADITDPQQRVFLEVCWEALEAAGYDPERYDGQIGVYAGSALNTYLLNNLLRDREAVQEFVSAYQVSGYNMLVGNDKDYLATRVAYKLNLRGPAVTVQTACSTSLVAVCQAVESLQSGQCDMALAGGVSITFPQERGYVYQEGGMASNDGHCRTFDANAAGTVFGAGAGVVLLKRLEDAIRDGDPIAAVIRGAAMNNDGSNKVSYLAPSVDGQAEAIAKAQEFAGVDPETITYVEAHGTGTPLGDPIEVAGLVKAFRARGAIRNQYCALGSGKSNIGHLAEAAGVTGLIKTVLSLQNRQLPPTLHYRSANPAIDFASSPFYVVDRLIPWPEGPTPRRAAVSSFGVGGTNAHVVLEEAPAVEVSGKGRAWQLLTLSARTPSALDAMAARLGDWLRAHPDVDIADVAHTLQLGRKRFANRKAVAVASVADAAAKLSPKPPPESAPPKPAPRSAPSTDERPVAFLFPGQGSQHVTMARELYDSEPTFRSDVDVCAEILQPHLGLDLRRILYPDAGGEEAATARLTETWLTQPALFTIEYALAMLWIDWGIVPDSLIGHSVGEYVAATLAGVFELPDALRILATRARLMQAQEAGAMLAVRLPLADVEALVGHDVSIAAVNSPALTVVSGTFDAIAAVEQKLAEAGKTSRRLVTSHAFHSAMMEPMLTPFREAFANVALQPPALPFVSNLTGEWITDEQATNPEYWVQHVRRGVQFAPGIKTLLADEHRVLLEVGPGNSLTTLARQNAVGTKNSILSSFDHVTSEASQAEYLLNALGKMWSEGASVNWTAVHSGERRYRVALPTYPFERKRHWVDPVNVYAKP